MSRYFFVFDLIDEYGNIVKNNNNSQLTVSKGNGELNIELQGAT